MVFREKYGFKEVDIPGSLAYTIANSLSYQNFSISLIKPDFHSLACESAKYLNF